MSRRLSRRASSGQGGSSRKVSYFSVSLTSEARDALSVLGQGGARVVPLVIVSSADKDNTGAKFLALAINRTFPDSGGFQSENYQPGSATLPKAVEFCQDNACGFVVVRTNAESSRRSIKCVAVQWRGDNARSAVHGLYEAKNCLTRVVAGLTIEDGIVKASDLDNHLSELLSESHGSSTEAESTRLPLSTPPPINAREPSPVIPRMLAAGTSGDQKSRPRRKATSPSDRQADNGPRFSVVSRKHRRSTTGSLTTAGSISSGGSDATVAGGWKGASNSASPPPDGETWVLRMQPPHDDKCGVCYGAMEPPSASICARCCNLMCPDHISKKTEGVCELCAAANFQSKISKEEQQLVDVVVVTTALVEFVQVRKALQPLSIASTGLTMPNKSTVEKTMVIKDGPTKYDVCHLGTLGGREGRRVAVIRTTMGNTGKNGSGQKVTRALQRWCHAMHVFMPGICGTLSVDVDVGTVIVSRLIIDATEKRDGSKVKELRWNSFWINNDAIDALLRAYPRSDKVIEGIGLSTPCLLDNGKKAREFLRQVESYKQQALEIAHSKQSSRKEVPAEGSPAWRAIAWDMEAHAVASSVSGVSEDTKARRSLVFCKAVSDHCGLRGAKSKELQMQAAVRSVQAMETGLKRLPAHALVNVHSMAFQASVDVNVAPDRVFLSCRDEDVTSGAAAKVLARMGLGSSRDILQTVRKWKDKCIFLAVVLASGSTLRSDEQMRVLDAMVRRAGETSDTYQPATVVVTHDPADLWNTNLKASQMPRTLTVNDLPEAVQTLIRSQSPLFLQVSLDQLADGFLLSCYKNGYDSFKESTVQNQVPLVRESAAPFRPWFHHHIQPGTAWYADNVLEASLAREIISVCSSALNNFTAKADLQATLGFPEQNRVFDLRRKRAQGDRITLVLLGKLLKRKLQATHAADVEDMDADDVLDQMFEEQAYPVVPITGFPGTGKTTLLLQFALRHLQRLTWQWPAEPTEKDASVSLNDDNVKWQSLVFNSEDDLRDTRYRDATCDEALRFQSLYHILMGRDADEAATGIPALSVVAQRNGKPSNRPVIIPVFVKLDAREDEEGHHQLPTAFWASSDDEEERERARNELFEKLVLTNTRVVFVIDAVNEVTTTTLLSVRERLQTFIERWFPAQPLDGSPDLYKDPTFFSKLLGRTPVPVRILLSSRRHVWDTMLTVPDVGSQGYERAVFLRQQLIQLTGKRNFSLDLFGMMQVLEPRFREWYPAALRYSTSLRQHPVMLQFILQIAAAVPKKEKSTETVSRIRTVLNALVEEAVLQRVIQYVRQEVTGRLEDVATFRSTIASSVAGQQQSGKPLRSKELQQAADDVTYVLTGADYGSKLPFRKEVQAVGSDHSQVYYVSVLHHATLATVEAEKRAIVGRKDASGALASEAESKSAYTILLPGLEDSWPLGRKGSADADLVQAVRKAARAEGDKVKETFHQHLTNGLSSALRKTDGGWLFDREPLFEFVLGSALTAKYWAHASSRVAGGVGTQSSSMLADAPVDWPDVAKMHDASYLAIKVRDCFLRRRGILDRARGQWKQGSDATSFRKAVADFWDDAGKEASEIMNLVVEQKAAEIDCEPRLCPIVTMTLQTLLEDRGSKLLTACASPAMLASDASIWSFYQDNAVLNNDKRGVFVSAVQEQYWTMLLALCIFEPLMADIEPMEQEHELNNLSASSYSTQFGEAVVFALIEAEENMINNFKLPYAVAGRVMLYLLKLVGGVPSPGMPQERVSKWISAFQWKDRVLRVLPELRTVHDHLKLSVPDGDFDDPMLSVASTLTWISKARDFVLRWRLIKTVQQLKAHASAFMESWLSIWLTAEDGHFLERLFAVELLGSRLEVQAKEVFDDIKDEDDEALRKSGLSKTIRKRLVATLDQLAALDEKESQDSRANLDVLAHALQHTSDADQAQCSGDRCASVFWIIRAAAYSMQRLGITIPTAMTRLSGRGNWHLETATLDEFRDLVQQRVLHAITRVQDTEFHCKHSSVVVLLAPFVNSIVNVALHGSCMQAEVGTGGYRASDTIAARLEAVVGSRGLASALRQPWCARAFLETVRVIFLEVSSRSKAKRDDVISVSEVLSKVVPPAFKQVREGLANDTTKYDISDAMTFLFQLDQLLRIPVDDGVKAKTWNQVLDSLDSMMMPSVKSLSRTQGLLDLLLVIGEHAALAATGKASTTRNKPLKKFEDSGATVDAFLHRDNKCRVVALWHPLFMAASLYNHPECAERARDIIQALLRNPDVEVLLYLPQHLTDQLARVQMDPATVYREWVDSKAVHNTEYMQALQRSQVSSAASGFVASDGDLEYRPGTLDMAKHAIFTAVLATTMAVESKTRDFVYCNLRPPGHLAGNKICLFNNVAVSALYYLNHLDKREKKKDRCRVLIFDMDHHHGQHTMKVFRTNPSVTYVSFQEAAIHPSTGKSSDIGKDAPGKGRSSRSALGTTIGIPFPKGMRDISYLYLLRNVLIPLGESLKPRLILISVGLDSLEQDPFCQGKLTPLSFEAVGHSMRHLARDKCEGVVGVLEGGYAVGSLGDAVSSLASGYAQRARGGVVQKLLQLEAESMKGVPQAEVDKARAALDVEIQTLRATLQVAIDKADSKGSQLPQIQSRIKKFVKILNKSHPPGRQSSNS